MTRKTNLKVIIPVIVCILLLIVIAVPLFYLLRPLPQLKGNLTVKGLDGKVEILRDARGTPHIYASSNHDLFFAQGYVQAQDRWWQMETIRYYAKGKIGELAGKQPGITEKDIYMRTFGFEAICEKEFQLFDKETQGDMLAFADGVNAYILNRNPSDLALEYSFLQLTGASPKIKPWTPADSLLLGKCSAHDMTFIRNREVARTNLNALLGEQMAGFYMAPPWPFDKKPTILRPEDCPSDNLTVTSMLDLEEDDSLSSTLVSGLTNFMSEPDYDPSGMGSNNWVVSGNLTVSGKPLLANDPHLGPDIPSTWYEIGLHRASSNSSPALDLSGFGFSTCPGIYTGRNGHIAWGITNVTPDVHDLYSIKVNPDNPLQYEWNGQWRDMTVRTEAINFVNGAPPVTIKIRMTHLGPIINDNQFDKKTGAPAGYNSKDPLALRWTALDPCTWMQSLIKLDKATNFQEFREALSYFDVPSQNFVYADLKGNIGYQCPGKIPMRLLKNTGKTVSPGWTDEYEWKGYIPYEDLPYIYNPSRGYIATANQRVVPQQYLEWLAGKLGAQYNLQINDEANYGYRAERIEQLIKELAPHTVKTFQAIQVDTKLVSATEVMPFLKPLHFESQELSDARDWLFGWDYMCNVDSPQAPLYHMFCLRLLSNLYNDDLGIITAADGGGANMWATYLLLQDPANKWWDDKNTKDVIETRDDILIRSFKEGYNNTVSLLGKDRTKWRWGDLHKITFVNSTLGVSGIAPLEALANRGPIGAPGSYDTINNGYWTWRSGKFNVFGEPPMRMIVDLGNSSNSMTINAPGESGHPFSVNYSDQLDDWLKGGYHTLSWTREQDEKSVVDTLVLNPR
jgi:penicillin G amidase